MSFSLNDQNIQFTTGSDGKDFRIWSRQTCSKMLFFHYSYILVSCESTDCCGWNKIWQQNVAMGLQAVQRAEFPAPGDLLVSRWP